MAIPGSKIRLDSNSLWHHLTSEDQAASAAKRPAFDFPQLQDSEPVSAGDRAARGYEGAWAHGPTVREA